MNNLKESDTLNDKNNTIKTETVSGETNDDGTSHSDDASSLMIDSEDESLNDNDNENFEAWRATERRLSTMESEMFDGEDDLGISMENKNTQRKTDTDIRIFITYLRSINEFRAPELIQPFHLDRYLSAFFSVVKKHDGNEYEPASLRGMLCSVERYLKLKNYPQSVTRDSVFSSTRNALKYKQQKLRELGKGSKKQPEPFGRLTLDKVNHLFSAHEMGPYTPMSVINTLCFLFIVHFRLRKAIDHKNLLWGDIKLQTDQSGKKYMIYEPVDIQTSIAHSKYDHHGNRLCIWEQPEVSERDPVSIYKLYAEKRPQNMKYENSPFYLGITSMQPSPLQSWYRTCAMGVNKLSDLVRMIRDITGLPRATMNAPTEFILSESYGIASTSKQDNGVCSIMLPETKSKVFTQSMSSTSDKLTDLSDQEMEDGKKDDYTENSNDKTSDDDDTADDGTTVLSGRSHTRDETDGVKAAFVGNEKIPFSEAKSTVENIIRRLDKNDLANFKRWIVSLTTESSHSEDLEEDQSRHNRIGSNSVFSFPSITLNIKISPDAISSSSPISVFADLKPVEDRTGRESSEKRKLDITENGSLDVKRFKDGDCSNPINLSYENVDDSVERSFRTGETFQKVRRISSNPGNTAVVHPRSEKINSQSNHGNETVITSNNKSTKLAVRSPPTGSDTNLGYMVPISYPYIGPNCFAQDPRMLINPSVVPHMAPSGVNSSYSFIQPSFRSTPK